MTFEAIESCWILLQKYISKMGDDLRAHKESQEFTIELLNLIIKYYLHDYDEIIASWKAVESKAQAIIAITGILIAAIGPVMSSASLLKKIEAKFLLSAIVILLILSVSFSMQVLKSRKVRAIHFGSTVEELGRDLLKSPITLVSIDSMEGICVENRRVDFFNDQIRMWRTSIDGYRAVYKHKIRCLDISQNILFLTLILFSVLSVWITLSS